MVAALLVMLMIAAWRFPESAFGQFVTRSFSAPIARWLTQVDRRQLIFVLLLLAVLVFAGEALAALGPLDTGLVLLWDVASYVDAAVAALTIASLTRRRGLGWKLRMLVNRRPRARAYRDARTRRAAGGTGANDDEDDSRFAHAA